MKFHIGQIVVVKKSFIKEFLNIWDVNDKHDRKYIVITNKFKIIEITKRTETKYWSKSLIEDDYETFFYEENIRLCTHIELNKNLFTI